VTVKVSNTTYQHMTCIRMKEERTKRSDPVNYLSEDDQGVDVVQSDRPECSAKLI